MTDFAEIVARVQRFIAEEDAVRTLIRDATPALFDRAIAVHGTLTAFGEKAGFSKPYVSLLGQRKCKFPPKTFVILAQAATTRESR